MQIGMVGLGKMGSGMARRLQGAGHQVVGFDSDSDALRMLAGAGLDTVASLGELVDTLSPPRVIWLMVPAGPGVDGTISALTKFLAPDDVLIDGGNSNYRDTRRRHEELAGKGIAFVDVGTSGGIRGEQDGYCLTIGGAARQVELMKAIFEALAPEPGEGWGHVGPSGAGHFVKMIHNGIEYGMMQALAEGFEILERRKEFGLDLAEVASIWNGGSVIRSWLLELASNALTQDSQLSDLSARVDDSGEGRWAVAEAIELDVAAPVITHALIARLQSRDPAAFSNKLLSALRREFGGHSAESEN